MNIPQRFVHIPIHPLNPCARDAEVQLFTKVTVSKNEFSATSLAGSRKLEDAMLRWYALVHGAD